MGNNHMEGSFANIHCEIGKLDELLILRESDE